MSKRVGNIFLIWRKGPGARRIAVGELKSNYTDGITFKYKLENVKLAENQGFTSYTGFPDIQKEYNKNVLEIFGQRLVKSERNDVTDFYEFWDVDISKKKDTYYMLAQTQGLLPIDNFEFLADFNPSKSLSFVTEIAGLSKYKLNPDILEIGDVLNYELEPQNPKDQYAVKLLKDKIELGYIKIIHSRVFHKTKRALRVTVSHIEKNGLIKRAFLKVTI